MNAKLQLITFIISFIYGIIFSLLIAKLKVIFKHLITFIYVLDMTIIYIIILYHLNKGYFHIYFIMTVFLGFVIGLIIYKKFLSKINVKRHFKN